MQYRAILRLPYCYRPIWELQSPSPSLSLMCRLTISFRPTLLSGRETTASEWVKLLLLTFLSVELPVPISDLCRFPLPFRSFFFRDLVVISSNLWFLIEGTDLHVYVQCPSVSLMWRVNYCHMDWIVGNNFPAPNFTCSFPFSFRMLIRYSLLAYMTLNWTIERASWSSLVVSGK